MTGDSGPGTAAVRVWRTTPGEDGAAGRFHTYEVPCEPGGTLLGALQYIQRRLDPGLAFRCGCRFRKCGICAVHADGEDRLACWTPLRDGMEVKPLPRLPVVRDLVVDRRGLMDKVRELELFASPGKPGEAAGDTVDRVGENLARCVECLACHAMCPELADDGRDNGFAGPYLFLKLAQMHFHPRNGRDRSRQASAAGIDRCADCRRCHCPYGVSLQRDVIGFFLGERNNGTEGPE